MEWFKLILFGIMGGLIGGMGMGGGTLLIPLLTLCAGIAQIQAQTINLISFIPMALVTLVIHIKNDLVDWRALLKVLPTALFFSAVASFFAVKLNVDVLQTLFGVFLLIIGSIFILNFTKEWIVKLLSPHKISKIALKFAKIRQKLKKS